MSAVYRYLCTIRNAPTSTAKTSTCAEMTAIRSHIYYDPRVLRMTVGMSYVVALLHSFFERYCMVIHEYYVYILTNKTNSVL